jgi:heme/copper-type cytochrome/quinol oxidase subunit 2
MSCGIYVTRCPATNTGERCQSSVLDFPIAHESSGSSSTIIMVVIIAVIFLLVLVVSLVLAYYFMRRRRRYLTSDFFNFIKITASWGYDAILHDIPKAVILIYICVRTSGLSSSSISYDVFSSFYLYF